jgi:hypothetical protein
MSSARLAELADGRDSPASSRASIEPTQAQRAARLRRTGRSLRRRFRRVARITGRPGPSGRFCTIRSGAECARTFARPSRTRRSDDRWLKFAKAARCASEGMPRSAIATACGCPCRRRRKRWVDDPAERDEREHLTLPQPRGRRTAGTHIATTSDIPPPTEKRDHPKAPGDCHAYRQTRASVLARSRLTVPSMQKSQPIRPHCWIHESSAVWAPPAARAAASASTRPSTRAGASASLPERRRCRSGEASSRSLLALGPTR